MVCQLLLEAPNLISQVIQQVDLSMQLVLLCQEGKAK
jgi:hypothetical protein